MQYILDAALLQARLLTVIAPWLFLYLFMPAHANIICMWFFCFTPLVASSQRVIESSEVCADYAVMVNRGDAVGRDDWRALPVEKQMAFRIPISTMSDLPHLRARHPVITVLEYLCLHGLDPEAESSRGSWHIPYLPKCLRALQDKDAVAVRH
jgi:hypothetical protein